MTDLEKANTYQEEKRVDESRKPVYHVTPPVGWMNDPNGFSIFEGMIHLFYQYHPYSDVWGPMHWGHYISKDFVNGKSFRQLWRRIQTMTLQDVFLAVQ